MKHYYQNVEGWFVDGSLYNSVAQKYDNAHFVEIGCWKGRSTSCMGVEIINSKNNIKFDVVDTFGGSAEHGNVDSEKLFNKFMTNIDPVRSAINTVHKMTSVQASELYADNSLDFVFIDASHDYTNVLADIKAWYPKIKFGGTMSGDDYCSDWRGVVDAVNEYFGAGNIKVYGTQHWAIVKS
jgi:hypothetical protein